MYLLDTNILSDFMKKSPSPKLLERMSSVSTQDQFTSSITLGELAYGALKKGSNRLSKKIEQLVRERIPVLPFDDFAAIRYSKVRVQLERQGTPISDADMRIAAIALDRQLTVVTANIKHFQRILGLNVENWL